MTNTLAEPLSTQSPHAGAVDDRDAPLRLRRDGRGARDRLGDLVGHSYGGRPAGALSASRLELVERAVVLDPAMHIDPPSRPSVRTPSALSPKSAAAARLGRRGRDRRGGAREVVQGRVRSTACPSSVPAGQSSAVGRTASRRPCGRRHVDEAGRGLGWVAGQDVLRDAVRRVIGYVPQASGVDREGRDARTSSFRAACRGCAGSPERRADELLELFGLSDKAGAQVKTYSGGQKRRLDVAMGLMHRPQVLFLDEPTTGLDPEARVAMWDELTRLPRRGRPRSSSPPTISRRPTGSPNAWRSSAAARSSSRAGPTT